MTAPLAGVRVLDFSRVIAGPFCTMQLADLGADVVKIEHPERGDDSRGMRPPEAGGESAFFLAFNRTKKSIALDLATPAGRAVVEALVEQSDVAVENFRPGVMERLGLGYETLAACNPRLVYCAISAYGRTGPHATRAGFDPVLQAESGLMSLTGEPEGEPMRHALAIVDTFTALYAAYAIVAALLARKETGRGQRIDVSLLDVSLAVLGNLGQSYLTSGANPERMGNANVNAIPVGLFRTTTRLLYIACGTDRLFGKLCRDVLGRPELASDARFARNADRATNRAALTAIIAGVFATDSAEAWQTRLDAAGLPGGPVRTVAEALESEDARGVLTTVRHPTAGDVRLVGSPVRLSETPVTPAQPPPLLGQHTEEVLRERLGYDAARIAALREAKVIP